MCAPFGLLGVMLVLMARCAIDTTAQFSESVRAREELTGTYIDENSSSTCDIRVMSGADIAAVRAVSVVYHSDAITLRVVPTNAVRVLHLQKQRQSSSHLPRSRLNGLARWIDGVLVVESVVPALPLWPIPGVPTTAATLLEAFAFSRASLSYKSMYLSELGAGVGNVLDLTLNKCGVVNSN